MAASNGMPIVVAYKQSSLFKIVAKSVLCWKCTSNAYYNQATEDPAPYLAIIPFNINLVK